MLPATRCNLRRESSRRSAGHRCGKNSDPRPGLGPANAAGRRASLRARRRREKDEISIPRAQAQFVLQNEACIAGWRPNRWPNLCSTSGREFADVLEVPATESDRRMLASILLKEDEELTAEVLEARFAPCAAFICAAGRKKCSRNSRSPASPPTMSALRELLTELERISRALRDPSLAEEGLKMRGRPGKLLKQKAF